MSEYDKASSDTYAHPSDAHHDDAHDAPHGSVMTDPVDVKAAASRESAAPSDKEMVRLRQEGLLKAAEQEEAQRRYDAADTKALEAQPVPSSLLAIEFYALDRFHAMTHVLFGLWGAAEATKTALLAELNKATHAGPVHVVVPEGVGEHTDHAAMAAAAVKPFEFVRV